MVILCDAKQHQNLKYLGLLKHKGIIHFLKIVLDFFLNILVLDDVWRRKKLTFKHVHQCVDIVTNICGATPPRTGKLSPGQILGPKAWDIFKLLSQLKYF